MKKFLKATGIVLGCIVALVLIVVGGVLLKARTSYRNLERIDEDGAFYSIDYVGNYESPLVSKALNIFSGGCSAFITVNEDGDIITCRNYDFPHNDTNGDLSGLNVLVRCSPKGKYSSVGMADMGLLSVVGLPYYAGCLDTGEATPLVLMYAPYLCMDGMNEKGLTVSILALDTKDGESPMHQTDEGKESLMINALLRELLDNCANLEEAVELTDSVNLMCTFGCDYHLFVTDAEGNSAVFEWRYNDFTVTYTNAATNFYVGYDDGEDSSSASNGLFVKAENVSREYHYGYGHGYDRFREVAEALERHKTDADGMTTSMTNAEAMDLLSLVSQAYVPGSYTSYTQYSVIYNNTDLTATICIQRDYEDVYEFAIG